MKTTNVLLLILVLIAAGCLVWRFASGHTQVKEELQQLQRAHDEQKARIRALEQERADREAERRVLSSVKRLLRGLLPSFLRIKG